jgi:ammonia channel protein AmtB
VLLIVLFGVFVRYPTTYTATHFQQQPFVQNVGLFVILGLGLRFSALEKFAWSSLGSAYIVTSICALFFILWNGLWTSVFRDGFDGKVILTLPELIDVYRAGAVGLIACAAAMGTVTILENSLFSTVLMIGYCFNKVLLEQVIKIVDVGGAITLHLFAGTAGLIFARLMRSPHTNDHPANRKSYSQATFALLGAAILFVLYPVFNGGSIGGLRQQLSFENTILGLCGSVLCGLAVSYYNNDRVEPNQFINAALSGAIAVASSGSFVFAPSIAFGEGCVAGAAVGFMASYVETKINQFDSLGVLEGHVFTGLLGGGFSIIFALGYKLVGYPDFTNEPTFVALPNDFGKQAAFQFVGIVITLLIAGLTGALAGGAMRLFGFVQALEDDFVKIESGEVKEEVSGVVSMRYETRVTENHFYHDSVDYSLPH